MEKRGEIPAQEFLEKSGKQASEERSTLSLEQVQSPEDFLLAVDFRTLNSLLDDLSRKSSFRRSTIGQDSIIFAETGPTDDDDESEFGIAGRANQKNRTITFYWDFLSKIAKSHIGVHALHTLIHEATHLQSFFELRDREVKGGDGSLIQSSFRMRMGVGEASFDSLEDDLPHKIAKSLNEAITETLSIELLNEYLRRTGESEKLDTLGIARDLSTQSYVHDRLVLSMVIDALAKRMEVDRDTIWKGFIEAYMNGSDQVIDLMVQVCRELPEPIDSLTYELLKDKSLDRTLSFSQLRERFGATAEYEEALKRVLYAFDTKHVKDVLRLS